MLSFISGCVTEGGGRGGSTSLLFLEFPFVRGFICLEDVSGFLGKDRPGLFPSLPSFMVLATWDEKPYHLSSNPVPKQAESNSNQVLFILTLKHHRLPSWDCRIGSHHLNCSLLRGLGFNRVGGLQMLLPSHLPPPSPPQAQGISQDTRQVPGSQAWTSGSKISLLL